MWLPQLAAITLLALQLQFCLFLSLVSLSSYIKLSELGQGGPPTWDADRWERPGVDWLICLRVNCRCAGWFPHVPHT